MGSSALRINMTGFNNDPHIEAQRYEAALEMAAYVDQAGFDAINVEEHHCAENGWLASPLTMAAMLAARTEQANLCVCALLVTLYDPVRLAEDIAVIDVVSKGRFSFIAGQGYRPLEYHAMDKDWQQRGKAMDLTLETLLKAWTGNPFDYKGQQVRVSPKPFSQPHPLIMVGGMSKVAARRAARFGLPFYPPAKMPELEAEYYRALKQQGKEGYVLCPPENASVLFVDVDPDQAWRELGQHFLQEVREYSSWRREGIARPLETDCDSADELREKKLYEILTPKQCIQRFKEQSDFSAVLHPLVGGMPIEKAWQSVRLYCEQVLPAIKDKY